MKGWHPAHPLDLGFQERPFRPSGPAGPRKINPPLCQPACLESDLTFAAAAAVPIFLSYIYVYDAGNIAASEMTTGRDTYYLTAALVAGG